MNALVLHRLTVRPSEWVDCDDIEDLGVDRYLELREEQRRRLALKYITRKEKKHEKASKQPQSAQTRKERPGADGCCREESLKTDEKRRGERQGCAEGEGVDEGNP